MKNDWEEMKLTSEKEIVGKKITYGYSFSSLLNYFVNAKYRKLYFYLQFLISNISGNKKVSHWFFTSYFSASKFQYYIFEPQF